MRIARTLRRLGIESVVAASIPDRRGLAVRVADHRVLLEGYSATETYLDIDRVIAAARETGSEAIHPGYGFLSERPDFAERCAAAGIVFVGPPAGVLRTLGDKSAARRLAGENDVPTVPGWDGEDDDATFLREAGRIGFPVMVKARGGGGGRGMRPVGHPDELPEALASARREAQAAFGDPRLLLEKLVTGAHHVEVQVIADCHGNAIHLGERDCSIQRRHQKLIEETPSQVVGHALRERLTSAALRLARAVGYVNAGTFEFLVEPDTGAFYFLEVNPRLQVEHPVTELVTGLDLVEWQLRVAAGEALPLGQQELRFAGHAIEFRINAEDPREGFRPSSGRIAAMEVAATAAGGPPTSYREDSGYEVGDTVPPQYDTLLAKRIVHAPDRASALSLAAPLLAAPIEGVKTNLGLHRAVVDSPGFRTGDFDVGWLDRNLDELLASVSPGDELWVAAALGFATSRQRTGAPFAQRSGWLGAGPAQLWLADDQGVRAIELAGQGPSIGTATLDGREFDYQWADAHRRLVRVGNEQRLEVRPDPRHPESIEVVERDRVTTFRLVPPPPLPRRAEAAAAGSSVVTAPLAGTVAAVHVAEGDDVEAGDLLVTLDAMKMEHRINALAGGTVARVVVAPGDVVREGDVLVEID